MRQYPIWNDVNGKEYRSDKSYGVRDNDGVTVRIGTSSNNSHEFVRHSTVHKVLADGTREYFFLVDGVCIRRATLAPKSKKPVISTVDFPARYLKF